MARSVNRNLFATLVLVGLAASHPVNAQSASIDGTWSGGGLVELGPGQEQARCRATFTSRGRDSFHMSARCATQSYRVEQTAELHRVSATRFSGAFYNAEYDIRGQISLTVSGSTLRATLTAPGGSAHLSLAR